MPSVSVTDPLKAMTSLSRSPSGSVIPAYRQTGSSVSDSRRSGAPRWTLPASTICEARSRADGVTMRLRIPEESTLTTGVSSKMRAPARRAIAARPCTYLRPSIWNAFGIIDAVEIAVGLEFVAHAVDLPALDLGLEILRQHLQLADQAVADIDIGDFERALCEGDARHLLLGGGGADEFGALLRQRPQFAGVVEADALDQLADRQAITRHDRAELVAGGVPADMPAFQHGDAGP